MNGSKHVDDVDRLAKQTLVHTKEALQPSGTVKREAFTTFLASANPLNSRSTDTELLGEIPERCTPGTTLPN
jgi:aminoglycoside N3'-acetyltransferase